MFTNLSLKARASIQTIGAILLQCWVAGAVFSGVGPGLTVGVSVTLGLFLLWLYLDSALVSKQFVESLVGAATRMSGGDLSQDVHTFGNPTLRSGLQAMQDLQTRIRAMVRPLADGARELTVASNEIAMGNSDLSNRTEAGSADLQQAAAALQELTESAGQANNSISEATQLGHETSRKAQSSGGVMRDAVESISKVRDSSHRIADIISVIDGIAFQTNILALNAAVEAARAGEQGRGFAVVASEVRNLAQRSAEAAKEIKSLITASVEQIESGSDLVNAAGSNMAAVVDGIERVAQIVATVANHTRSQHEQLETLSASVAHLDGTFQQNAALVEQEAAAAESLKHQAVVLHKLVEVFRLS